MRLLVLLPVAAASAAAVILLPLQVSAGRGPVAGRSQPIKNLSDPYVREIAEFAVKAHNDDAKTGLVLKKVVKGNEQIVEGTIYRLVVEVKDGADTRRFEAKVWDIPFENFRRLDWFKAVQGNA